MTEYVIKHEILRQLYHLEDHFDVNSLEECKNLIGLMSVFFLDDEVDPDIKVSLQILLKKIQQILREEKPRTKNIDDNLILPYEQHSSTFTSLLSQRIFSPINPNYHYHNSNKKGSY